MDTAGISRTVRSSELSRHSASVFRAAEEGPVTITRRDGEPLTLAKSSDIAYEQEGLELAAQLMAVALSDEPGPFVDRLRGPFPWLEFLSSTDRDSFAREIVDVARACASVSRFDRLLVTLRAWRSTAEAISAGYTPDDELEWMEDADPVLDPRTA
ncbi:hypothetical protein [Arthrobacter castelli]|uniref:hypothetical protein n=1 Tax=Arthrobacter castelli TaxID=271431 RepID=UPI0004792315|nr:hypothetical protein [Arthrobacter castelli]